MKFYESYKEKLENLLIDENNIFFFCDLIKDKVRYNSNECLKIINCVIEYCEKNNLDEAKAWMYYYLAWNYSDSSDFDKCIEIFEKAKDIFEKHDNKKGLAYIYNGLTSFYCQNGQLEISNEIGLRGISIARELTDDDILLKILVNISITNIQNKSYEAAKEILNYLDINYNYSQISFMNEIMYDKSMAEIELNIGDPHEALKLIEKALIIDKEIGVSIFTTEGHKLLAMTYAKLNMLEEADKEFSLSVKIALENNNKLEYCETLLEWSIFYFNINRDKEALEFLDTIIKVTIKNRFISLLSNSSNLLYNYYKKANNYEMSLKYLEIYIQTNKEIYNYKSKKLMAKLNVDHDEKEMNLYRLLFDKTELLSKIGQKIISELDVDSMVLYINSEINKLIITDFSGIILYNSDTDEIIHRTVVDGKIVKKGPIKLGDGSLLSEYCIRNKKTVFINNARRDSKRYVKKVILVSDDFQEPLSIISIPLMVNNEVIGVMSIQSMKENAYESNDVNTLKVIGNYAAIALKNASEYKKMEEKAIYDSLTGFLTKREILAEGNAVREGFLKTQKSFCLLMIDIDDFKTVNDTYGHLIGDNIIKLVTNTISKLIRPMDYIGRYGGDEFLLICPNINKNNALRLAERIRQVIENTDYIVDENVIIKTTISTGVYEFNNSSLSIIEGINLADLTMYKAKYSKKNKVMVF